MTRRRPDQGFTLVELLIVIILIGVISGMGVVHYSRLTSETRTETTYASLNAFFQACRERARQRGTDIHLQLTPRGVGIRESSRLVCPAPSLSPASGRQLEEIRFTASQTLRQDRPIDAIRLEFQPPGSPPYAWSFSCRP